MSLMYLRYKINNKPETIECMACAGTGKINLIIGSTIKRTNCPECKGKGYIEEVDD